MLEELTYGFPMLSVLLFLPLLGALALWPQRDVVVMKRVALGVACLELILSVALVWLFIPASAAMQFSERLEWMPALGMSYHLAVDGISVLFVPLSALLTVLIMLYSWDTIRERVTLYFMALLALETTIIGVFVSIDLILFFVFWELMLVPGYFLIKLWGVGEYREDAALKFVLYTLLGSVFMLVGFALLSLNAHAVAGAYSFDFLELLTIPVSLGDQLLVFWLIFLGLAFKAPVFPFHSWLPDALVQGPVGMSVVLAGVKLGTYGFLRFAFPLTPDAAANATVVAVVTSLALAAIVWGAVVAIMQTDFRRLLVFSSISHLGFVALGLFALNVHGVQGGLLHMINLGVSTAGLFFFAGFLYDRLGHTMVDRCGGLAATMPWLATGFLIVGMASIGLPGTNGFVGEFLILLGAFQAHWVYGVVAVSGVVFAAVYFLWYYERAMFGPVGAHVPRALTDLTPRESVIAVSLCVMIIGIGLYPSPLLRVMDGSVRAVMERLDRGALAVAPRDRMTLSRLPATPARAHTPTERDD